MKIRQIAGGVIASCVLSAAAPAFAQIASQNGEVVVASQVFGLSLTPGPELPPGPDSTDFCPGFSIKPETGVGADVALNGWILTDETQIGPFTVVSFAGDMETGTSGSCLVPDGRLAFFLEDELVAVLSSGLEARVGLAGIVPMDDGRFRLMDGDYVRQPVADIRAVGEKGVIVAPLPASEPFCAGAVETPNIHALPLSLARAMLADSGWSPAPEIPAEELTGEARYLAELGFTEANGCSGTGFGFCGFSYGAGEHRLHVTTVGEAEAPGPVVTDYRVECAEG